MCNTSSHHQHTAHCETEEPQPCRIKRHWSENADGAANSSHIYTLMTQVNEKERIQNSEDTCLFYSNTDAHPMDITDTINQSTQNNGQSQLLSFTSCQSVSSQSCMPFTINCSGLELVCKWSSQQIFCASCRHMVFDSQGEMSLSWC